MHSPAPSSTMENSTSPDRMAQNSTLYREFLAERAEILRHKWLESEKQGSDIDFDRALLDWVIRHRQAWRSHRAGECATASC
jgi:hypothetical protein